MSEKLQSLLAAALGELSNGNALFAFLEALAEAGGTIPSASSATPQVDDAATGAAGTSSDYARGDHKHQVATGTPVSVGVANSDGTSDTLARADHVHAHGNLAGGTLHALATPNPGGVTGFVSPATLDQIDLNTANILSIIAALGALLSNTNPQPLGVAAPGASGQASRADHVHAHGNLAGGALHALATTLDAGFMSAADVVLLNLLAPLATPSSQFVARPDIAGPGLTTRAPGAVFEGSQIDVPKRAQVQNLYGRLTGFTTLGAGLRVTLYQVPGGGATGVAVKLAEGVVTPAAVGAQDITVNFGAPVTLEPGVAYLLYGRTNATAGVTLRTWSIGTIERLTTTVPAGLPPITFTTALASTAAGPATLNVPAALTASTVSPAFCGRFGP